MKAYIKNIRFIIAPLVLGVLFSSCYDGVVFDNWENPRLEIRIKGTYESNSANIITPTAGNCSPDDSIDDQASNGTDVPTILMMDIAEIRLRRASGGTDRISNYRTTFRANLDGTGTNGALFFGDEGIELPTDEAIPGKTYSHVLLYIRKMAFDGARKYLYTPGSGYSDEGLDDFMFAEKLNVPGFDFNQLQPNSAYDQHQKNANYINRVFPVEIPIPGGFTFEPEKGTNVLEIRVVVANFIKKYEHDYVFDTELYATHFFGPSDWLRDVQADEPYIGGNLHGVARGYVKGNTGTITTGVGGGQIAIAIPNTLSITNYGKDTTNADRTNVGAYDLPLNPQSHVSLILDYFMRFEQHKANNWGVLDPGSNPTLQDDFESAWNTYENAADQYTVAPLAVHGSINNVITNVQPGTYDVYYVGAPTFGELVDDSDIGGSPDMDDVVVTVP